MNIRKLVYIVKDQLKNGTFRSNIADLTSQFNHQFPAQTSRAQAITKYAIENTPYYSNYKNYNDFSEFPVLEKSAIKENYNDFISIPYKNQINNLHKVQTSGSYGTPFAYYLNAEKRSKVVSEVYYFGKTSNFYLGSKHAHIVTKSKSKIAQLAHNQLRITVGKLNDDWCRNVIASLQKNNIKLLVGYPSAISRLAYYLIERKTTLKMDGIITISEVLTPNMRLQIQQGFECLPISRYSSEEFGVLANQDISGEFFWLNQCNYLIEILELDTNKPASIGSLGRIVVTDLFNKSMPLIRYDTGDLAEPIGVRNGLVLKVKSIEGRKLATIKDTSGEIVSSFTINGVLRSYQDIIQFQFSQEREDIYKLRVVTRKEEIDEDSICLAYQDILGSNATIIFEYVEDIPPQKSGKRPYIIQNYYTE